MNKEDILKEIQQAAKENGGIPLGLARFEKKTGIKVYDWMRFWPRFSDVLKDAGFNPNKMTTSYKDEYLFEKFIELIRDIKKWPVKGDRFVKSNKTPGFPSQSTFDKFGTKLQFATKLLKYAEGKKYKDILKICCDIIAEYENKQELSEEKSLTNKIGSVYLVRSGRYYKIGRTDEMDRRHHEIKIQLPEGLELIHEIKTDDPSGIEMYWHKRFDSKRKNGEWFDLGFSDIKAFRLWRRIA